MKTLIIIALMYLVLMLSTLGTLSLYLWSEYRVNHYELIERKDKNDNKIVETNI